MKYPFTPEVLDALPEEVAELFRQVEDLVLDGVCSKLEAAKYLSAITVQDLSKMRNVSTKDIQVAIRKATKAGEAKISAIMDSVEMENTRFYTELGSKTLSKKIKPIREVSVTRAIREQTLGEYRNITGSMGFLVDSGRTMLEPAKAYQWALDNAVIQVQSGAVSYEQAVKVAVRSLAKSGIKTVSYESGKVEQVDVAVRRAVLTGANQLCLKFAESAMDNLYTDLVEVSAHIGARNKGFEPENHEMWQGKIYRWVQKPRYSTGDYPDFIRHTGYGSGEGLGGWNCRHSFHAYVEGVSEPTYTQDELDAMKGEARKITFEGREYDGYEATQKQRQIERTLRRMKRERSAYKAAGLKEDANSANIRIRRLARKYKKFSKVAGLPEQNERTRVQYVDDQSTSFAQHRAEVIEQVKSDIQSGKYPLTLNPEKQSRHMADTAIPGRSVITVSTAELQEIINKTAGNGRFLLTSNSSWRKVEIVDAGRAIGYTVSEKNGKISTTRMKIHYSGTGTHAVPYSHGG